MRIPLPLLAAALLAGAIPAMADEGADLYDRVRRGKAVLKENCVDCHELAWPLKKIADRGEWEEILDTMQSRGAIFGETSRGLLLDFLVAKSEFQSKCTACHDGERVMSVRKSREQWEETVERMSEMSPEKLAEGTIEAIAAYLALERGPE